MKFDEIVFFNIFFNYDFLRKFQNENLGRLVFNYEIVKKNYSVLNDIVDLNIYCESDGGNVGGDVDKVFSKYVCVGVLGGEQLVDSIIFVVMGMIREQLNLESSG